MRRCSPFNLGRIDSSRLEVPCQSGGSPASILRYYVCGSRKKLRLAESKNPTSPDQGRDETRSSSRAYPAIFGPFCTCNCVNVWVFVCSSESHAVSCEHHLVRTIIDFRIQSRYLPYYLRSPGQLPGYKFWPSHLFRSPPILPFRTMAHTSQPFQSKFSSAARRRLSSLDNTVRPAAIASLQVNGPTRSPKHAC